MHPLPVEISDAPPLLASVVWGTVDRLGGGDQVRTVSSPPEPPEVENSYFFH